MLLCFRLCQDFQLILEIGDCFLVFLAKHMGCLLRFQMDVFEQLAQFSKFGITLLVDLQLRTEKNGSDTNYQQHKIKHPLI